MNRILTASVALAATLGTAGLALAQGAPGTNMQSPGMTTQTPGMTATPPNAGASPAMAPGNGGALQQQGSVQNSQPASQANIQQAQQQLRSQGLYKGAIDGQLGPEMRTALTQFQQRNGLPQTGTLDQQTSARLAQSSNNNLSPTPTSGSAMPGDNGGSQMNSPASTTH